MFSGQRRQVLESSLTVFSPLKIFSWARKYPPSEIQKHQLYFPKFRRRTPFCLSHVLERRCSFCNRETSKIAYFPQHFSIQKECYLLEHISIEYNFFIISGSEEDNLSHSFCKRIQLQAECDRSCAVNGKAYLTPKYYFLISVLGLV